jgi:hypothetical protein
VSVNTVNGLSVSGLSVLDYTPLNHLVLLPVLEFAVIVHFHVVLTAEQC